MSFRHLTTSRLDPPQHITLILALLPYIPIQGLISVSHKLDAQHSIQTLHQRRPLPFLLARVARPRPFAIL